LGTFSGDGGGDISSAGADLGNGSCLYRTDKNSLDQ
jgi:hypothetical protein